MSSHKIKNEIHLSDDDRLDIILEVDEHGEITQFVINYRARFKETGDEWHEIYRIDTRHGYLHEQRYWISPDPIRIDESQKSRTQFAYEAIDRLKTDHLRFKQKYRMNILCGNGKGKEAKEKER